jgi:hypothetical protein
MPALNLPLSQISEEGHRERKVPLLPISYPTDVNDDSDQRNAERRHLPQHVQPAQQQYSQHLKSPSHTSCIGQCQTLFSLQHDNEDDDIGDLPRDHPETVDTAFQNNNYYQEASEWPLQHLAIFEQLETEYDQALQDIKLDLKAKLYWIRYSAGYSVIFVIVYLLIGILFFRQVTDWTLPETILFAVYTMTSAGYGCYKTPRTNTFQLFQIFYILIGIAALAIMVRASC